MYHASCAGMQETLRQEEIIITGMRTQSTRNNFSVRGKGYNQQGQMNGQDVCLEDWASYCD